MLARRAQITESLLREGFGLVAPGQPGHEGQSSFPPIHEHLKRIQEALYLSYRPGAHYSTDTSHVGSNIGFARSCNLRVLGTSRADGRSPIPLASRVCPDRRSEAMRFTSFKQRKLLSGRSLNARRIA